MYECMIVFCWWSLNLVKKVFGWFGFRDDSVKTRWLFSWHWKGWRLLPSQLSYELHIRFLPTFQTWIEFDVCDESWSLIWEPVLSSLYSWHVLKAPPPSMWAWNVTCPMEIHGKYDPITRWTIAIFPWFMIMATSLSSCHKLGTWGYIVYHMCRQTRGQIEQSHHFLFIVLLSIHVHLHNRNLQRFCSFLNLFEPEMLSIYMTFLDVFPSFKWFFNVGHSPWPGSPELHHDQWRLRPCWLPRFADASDISDISWFLSIVNVGWCWIRFLILVWICLF